MIRTICKITLAALLTTCLVAPLWVLALRDMPEPLPDRLQIVKVEYR